MPTTAVATVEPRPSLPAHLAATAERARAYAADAVAENTKRAYQADWDDFAAWCKGSGLDAMPAAPATVALYLTDRAEILKTSTLRRRLTAITTAHRAAGHDLNTRATVLRDTWKGIQRRHGAPAKGKAPLLTDAVAAMVRTLPDTMTGLRNRALLLVGFAGAFRRSELAALRTEDCCIGPEGLTVTIPRSKTDQGGEGQVIGIPFGARPETCPVRALQQWMAAAAIEDGPLFRPLNRNGTVRAGAINDKVVVLVVKAAAEAAGLDAGDFAGHSLRSGFATAAARNGVTERIIQKQTRHRSLTVLRGYIRDGDLFRENAAGMVGL